MNCVICAFADAATKTVAAARRQSLVQRVFLIGVILYASLPYRLVLWDGHGKRFASGCRVLLVAGLVVFDIARSAVVGLRLDARGP